MKLKDRVVIVTGSSSGVGAATALMCAEEGASLVVNYSRNQSGAEATAQKCRDAGGKAIVVQANVAEDADCRALAEAAVSEFGRIDALVNNAGTTKFCPMENLEGVSAEDFSHIFGVNLVGPFQMARACAPHLRKNPGSAIVNVSSIAGILGTGSSIPYAASKGALITMTLALARVLAPEVRVNAVCPGFIAGDWLQKGLGDDAYEKAKSGWESGTPLERVATNEDIAEAIFYLISGARNVTGETITLDSGYHLKKGGLVQRSR